MDIRVALGDITESSVDAIVTAANSSLVGGGGVDEPAADLLASAYLSALARCDEMGAVSVAVPSTGAYRFPLIEACQICIAALRGASTSVRLCGLVAFDVETERCWNRALAELDAAQLDQ